MMSYLNSFPFEKIYNKIYKNVLPIKNMLNQKEITVILMMTIILGFLISLIQTLESFLYALIFVFIIIMLNTFAKKITSFYLDSEIEVRLWDTKRVGILHFIDVVPLRKTHPSREFDKPFPTGAVIPIISKVVLFPFNSFVWMASLVFDVKPKIHRAAKRYGLYTFSEMTEYHIGLIAAAGILVNLVFAIIAYFLNFTEFAKLSIYFAFFNMIPLSDLDGNKIFFGSLILWTFLAAITLIGLLSIILII